MTAPFVVIGCGKAKRALALGETCRAIDLYTGPLFAARLAHARALGGPHAILSAAYTLLTPDAEVSGYEADLRRRSKRERADWARNVAHAIKMLTKPGQRVIVLASGPYSAFADHLVAGGRDVVVLGEGMQLGELISYHQREAARLAAEVGEVVAESPSGLTTEGGIEWWLADTARAPLTDSVTCEVRGDVMRELLAAYVELRAQRETSRAA